MEGESKVSNGNGECGIFASLTQDQLVRGKTPDDINERCLSLCQAFIGGSWSNARIDQIKVTRITGGLTNQLYRVQLDVSVPRSENTIYREDEPTDVALKLFQSKYIKLRPVGERLDDQIILTSLSELSIGPKVYGIFNDGTIQAYTEHEHFRPIHQKEPELIRALANLLVQIHNMNVPVRKNDTWPICEIDKKLAFGYSQTPTLELIESLNLVSLKSIDLRDEFAALKGLLDKVASPRVFSHNDYIGTNILICKNRKLVAIDFEYSSYFARAFDIAVYHAQWGIEPFDYDNLSLPEDSVLLNFINLYIEAFDQLTPGYSRNPENSAKKILAEVKLYMLLYLFYCISAMMAAQESIIESIPFSPESNMKYVERGIEKYKAIKRRLIEDGTIES